MIKTRLKELIKEKDIKPKELAIELGMSGEARVYDWLSGAYVPNYDSLLKLANYFNCSIEFLLGRTEDSSYIRFKENKNFDEQLRNIMRLKRISQYKMTKDKILNPNHFNRYFVKKIKPSVETLIKLADYFNISVDELVGRV